MDTLSLSNNRQISFEELRHRPTLLLEFVKERNPQLYEEIFRAKRNYTGAVQAKNSLDDQVQIEKMSVIVSQTKANYDALLEKAESFAFFELEKEKSSDQIITTEPDQTIPTLSDQTSPAQNVQISKTEFVYRNIAQAILMSGVTSIVDIARLTGLSLSVVQQTTRSAEFQNFLNLANEQLPPPAIVSNNGRLRELIKQYNQIERIIFERSLSASLPTQVSDEEFIALGVSPSIRDPLLARIPGASQGLISKIPVVSRVMGGEGRGGRSEIVYNYQFDATLQARRESLIKEIRTEMADAGIVSKTKRKTYGFDTDGI